MANAVYPTYKAACMSGGPNVNLVTGSVCLLMVDTSLYAYSPTHQFLTDVPSGAQIGQSVALTGNAVTAGGAFQAGNGRFNSVTGAEVSAIIGFINTGSPSTSRLVWYDDTGIAGLPVTPAGAAYNVIPDPSGYFVL
jgi:hypothetical protein